MIGGLTERKMKNRRFRQTEEIIFKTYFSLNEEIKMKELAKITGVSRVTLYRHHKTVNKILPDYEHYIYREFLKEVGRIGFEKRMNVRLYFYRMLSFILANKEVFKVFFVRERTEVIKKMIKKAQPMISLKYHMPKNAEMIFEVYNNEILGVIEGWNKEGLREKDIAMILEDILYLTDSARHRLMPLVN